jgi:hypothetical protein
VLEVGEGGAGIDLVLLQRDFVDQKADGQQKEILVRPVYVLSAQAIPFPDANVESLAVTAEASVP